MDANEAKQLGEGLYDDYVDFERAAEPDANKVILVVDTLKRKTRVWAADGATTEDATVIAVRHKGYHFTALLPAKDCAAVKVLQHLPRFDEHSYVGPPDFLSLLLKAQSADE